MVGIESEGKVRCNVVDLEQTQRPWVDTLRNQLGDIVSTVPEYLESHGRDEGYEQAFPPECVVYVCSKEDILRTLEVAREHGVPVTAFGAGSGLEGNAIPSRP